MPYLAMHFTRAFVAVLLFIVSACPSSKKLDANGDDEAQGATSQKAFESKGEGAEKSETFDGGIFEEPKRQAPLPWRSEMERTAFELALALPGGAVQTSEDVGPVRRFQERRKKMSFFVEKRGSAAMPQTISLEDASAWYVEAYEGQDVVGPRRTKFGGRDAVRVDFETVADKEPLYVSVFVTFRGGFIYGVGIEGDTRERTAAGAARLAQTSRFLGVEPSVYGATAKSLSDLQVVLPASSHMKESPAFGGVSFTDRSSRMHLLVSRVPKNDASWAQDVATFRDAVEEEQFKGFVYRGSGKARVGLAPGFELRYLTQSRGGDGAVYIVQTLVESYGYVYLFTASSHVESVAGNVEEAVKAFSDKALRGARFRKPF